MNLHYLRMWLRHRLRAKGRHGTHSPFVYALMDLCVLTREPMPLSDRIRHFFSGWELRELSAPPAVLPVVPDGRPMLYLVPDIHSNIAATKAWAALSASTQIQYSLDFLDFGLLLAHPDFKEKQHFLLKTR